MIYLILCVFAVLLSITIYCMTHDRQCFQFLETLLGVSRNPDDDQNDEEYQEYLAWRKKRSDALDALQQDALDRERKEPYRSSETDWKIPGTGFKDFRCKICKHGQDSHFFFERAESQHLNGCVRCPVERRCIKFVKNDLE